jgi:hypothetical protein
MFLAILFITFMQISLFGAAEFSEAIVLQEEEGLPWAAQQRVQTQAVAYNEHCKSTTIINLRDDLDLWSLLVFNKICGRKNNQQSLAWISNQKDIAYAEVNTLAADLADYRDNIALFEGINDYNENDATFALWLSTTAQGEQGIEAVRAWALYLERRHAKFQQLHTRLNAFYETALEDILVSKEGTIAFILASPGEVLGPLLEVDPEGTRHKVEKLVTDTFFPDDEEDEELDEGAGGVAGGVGADE